MASTEAGDLGYRGLLAALHESLRSLVMEGLVGEDEAARMGIPTVGRTREEFAVLEEGFAG